MRHTLAIILALGFAAIALCQDAITVPEPKVVEVKQRVAITLSDTQINNLVALLASAKVTIPKGVTSLQLRQRTDGNWSVYFDFTPVSVTTGTASQK